MIEKMLKTSWHTMEANEVIASLNADINTGITHAAGSVCT